MQLFVLFVGTTGDRTSTDFADETAKINSLGADDALLLVAIDDHTDAIWVSDSLPITDAELNAVISEQLEPALQDGDFGGAVIATAAGIGAAADVSNEPTVGPGPTVGPKPTAGVVVPPPDGPGIEWGGPPGPGWDRPPRPRPGLRVRLAGVARLVLARGRGTRSADRASSPVTRTPS